MWWALIRHKQFASLCTLVYAKSEKQFCVPMSLARTTVSLKENGKSGWENRLHLGTFFGFFTNRILVDGKKSLLNITELRKMKKK